MYTRDLQHTTSAILEKVQKEYSVLTGDEPVFSLLQLFSFDGFSLDEYCQVFSPHPEMQRLLKETRDFGKQYGIWIPNAEHYISCAAFLYPNAGLDRMRAIMQNLAIDYYLNDTIGRDIFAKLPEQEQAAACQLKERLFKVREDLYIDEHKATPLELANIAVLTFMHDTSPHTWFREFLRLYAYHIHVTHKDCNINAMGRVASVDEYIDSRCHLAGMHHVVSLVEYSEGHFLDWELLAGIGVERLLRRLHHVTAAIGGLMNDLFSFEKEVIANGADSNLVMIILYNRPELSLAEAIERAAALVRSLLIEFRELLGYVKAEAGEAMHMAAYFKGLERCVQASWLWQVHTRRYKSAASIFLETRLNDGVGAR